MQVRAATPAKASDDTEAAANQALAAIEASKQQAQTDHAAKASPKDQPANSAASTQSLRSAAAISLLKQAVQQVKDFDFNASDLKPEDDQNHDTLQARVKAFSAPKDDGAATNPKASVKAARSEVKSYWKAQDLGAASTSGHVLDTAS